MLVYRKKLFAFFAGDWHGIISSLRRPSADGVGGALLAAQGEAS